MYMYLCMVVCCSSVHLFIFHLFMDPWIRVFFIVVDLHGGPFFFVCFVQYFASRTCSHRSFFRCVAQRTAGSL